MTDDGRWTLTTPAKDCGCGVLEGEECDCAAFAAELHRVPVFFLPRRAASPATDTPEVNR